MERDGLHLPSAVPKINSTLTPTASMAIRLWETFTPFLGTVRQAILYVESSCFSSSLKFVQGLWTNPKVAGLVERLDPMKKRYFRKNA